MHSDQFKPKSYFKLMKKYIFSEGEQFPLMEKVAYNAWLGDYSIFLAFYFILFLFFRLSSSV